MGSLDEWYRNLYSDTEGPARFEGAPVSLQLVGRRFSDENLLRILARIRGLLVNKP